MGSPSNDGVKERHHMSTAKIGPVIGHSSETVQDWRKYMLDLKIVSF